MKHIYYFLTLILLGCGASVNGLKNRVITDNVIQEKNDTPNVLSFPPYVLNPDSNEINDLLIKNNLLGPDSTRVDQYPEQIGILTIMYPKLALRRPQEGDVYLRLWIKSDGTVRKAKAVMATDNIFVEPALIAAMNLKVKPVKKDGKLTEVSIFDHIKFRLSTVQP